MPMSAATAVELPSAQSLVSAGVSIDGTTTEIGPSPQSLSLTFDRSDQIRSEQASVVADLGPGPSAGSIVAHAAAVSTTLNEFSAAEAAGSIAFDFAVVQTNVPSIEPAFVPIEFEAKGQGSGNHGSGAVWYLVGAFIEANKYGDVIEYNGPGPSSDSFDFRQVIDASPDQIYQAFIDVDVMAATFVAGPANEAFGLVDPTVTFDQAAFDALYGLDSFPLAEYYQIRLSPNIPTSGPTTPMPEPSTLAILGVGLGGLIIRRARKWGRPAPNYPGAP
jgi:hypothetical protein